MSRDVMIVGAAERPYKHRPDIHTTTSRLLVDAACRALDHAGLHPHDIDGLGLTSFSLAPDHAIDFAWRMGMSLDWIMEDTNGGASGVNLLLAAKRAIENGDATTVLLVAGDRYLRRDFDFFTDHYNKATRDWLAPIPLDGPNTLFSFVTQRHAAQHGLEREDYGQLAIAQRRWASKNPLAVYRKPMTMDDYLGAPPVAPPLGRFDCVPIVSGADAIVVTTADRVRNAAAVRIGPIRARYNHDKQEGEGWTTGLSEISDRFWDEAEIAPGDVGHLAFYDDYPVMVLAQLADLGFVEDGDVKRFIRRRYVEDHLPINTSGGMLSAGQAGAGAALHGIVEAVTQLRGEAGARQVHTRNSLVTGYGMVVFRYGACSNVALLERVA